MIRLVISNQKGGVAKTTTAICLARSFAERGKKVLLVDTDAQGSIQIALGLKPTYHLYHLLIEKLALKECLTPAHPNIDVVCSNKQTNHAEDMIASQAFREFVFEHVIGQHDHGYDVVLVDVSPSISLFQTCAMVYTRQALIPVTMDSLSVQGAIASVHGAEALNALFPRSPLIQATGILPVLVDRRLAVTETILATLREFCERRFLPLLPPIRTDTTVVKASRARQFLADFDPKAKAVEDYNRVAGLLLEMLEVGHAEKQAVQV